MKSSPIRYPGKKTILADWIISFFPPHKVYNEPYGGAAAVLFNKPRALVEIYNDTYCEIVNFFEVLRDKEEQLIRAVTLTPFARDEVMRAIDSADPVERARLFVLRSHGSFATNAITHLNHKPAFRCFRGHKKPGAATTWQNMPEILKFAAQRLKGVTIENKEALFCLKKYDTPETLHYVDPPYPPWLRKKYLYAHEMNEEQHIELLDVLLSLEGKVVLSGFSCELYNDKLKNWRRHDRNHYADGAKPIIESIWTNFENELLEGIY